MNYKWNKGIFRLEIILLSIVLVSAMLFSIEPTREFFIESTIEKQFVDLEAFKNMVNALQYEKPGKKDLKYILCVLEGIKNRNPQFIMKEDVNLLIAKTYDRMGEKSQSISLFQSLLKSSSDPYTRIDSLLELAAIYDRQDKPKKALELVLANQYISPYYKKGEIAYLLSRLFYQTGRIKDSGKSILDTTDLDEDEQLFYVKVVQLNWPGYSRSDKQEILKKLSRLGQYKAYADLAFKYIKEISPDEKEVENLSFDLVYNSRQDFVKAFLQKLHTLPAYESIYSEMHDLYTVSKASIQSASAKVRGSYCYRQLRPVSLRSKYNMEKASLYYENYLKGEIDPEYAVKNLQFVIRNMIAFKNYDAITNFVGMTYAKLGMTQENPTLAEDISFWNGYACYQMKDNDNALRSFESTVSMVPDGYYAIQARTLMETILLEQNYPLDDYIRKLEDKVKNSEDKTSKIYYSRILYALESGLRKEKWKDNVVELTKQYSDSAFFDFDSSVFNRIKNSPNYIKFVIYTRYGMVGRAKAVLSSADISDPIVQDILVLKEHVKNKNFQLAWPLYCSLAKSDFINENFCFFSKDLQSLLYPLPYESEINLALNKLNDELIDKYLVYAIIRGESMYIPKIRSHAGARGLMQIMPATARLISKKVLDMREVNLYNPLNNILLGTYYLNDGVKSIGMLPAIASYNGGTRMLDKTKVKFNPANEIELMEIMPYQETREYIKKIMSFYYRYRVIYERTEWNVRIIPVQKRSV